MPYKTINKFEVKYLQILDEKGKCDSKLMPSLKPNELKRFYEFMVLARKYDERALILQRQGRMGVIASLRGQEAIHIGTAFGIKDSDWIVPSFRCDGVYIVKGYPLETLYQSWGGDERGNIAPKDMNILPAAVPVGTQTLHAVGIGMAARIKKDKIGVITYFGDGATSEGDLHEAMNFASVYKAPVVFICQNNQYAISLPVSKQTGAKTIAQKAIGYGFEGIKVDGNDVFAVYKATKEALEKARKGKGPSLIECFTYRMGDHTTSDDSGKYRTKSEVKKWEEKDPIERLKKYLLRKKIVNKEYFEDIDKKIDEKIDIAVKKYLTIEKDDPENILKFMYKDMPLNLKDQLEELKLRMKLKDGN